MKTWKILLAVLLTVAMLCVGAACANQETPADEPATVTFYNGSEVYKTVTVKVGEKLTLPEEPKAEKGLGLAGWSTIDGDVEEIIDPDTFVVNGDLSLYAVWADVCTVTINPDNGQPFDVREVLIGTTIEKPEDPVKEGFRFVEWRDALQETTFDFSQPIYGDVIVKAMYGDGSANRVSDTKWDFSTGIHGAWIGAQGGWKYEVDGLPAEDMVYQTTEDGYAAWGFTLTDSLENIPVIDGNNGKGLGMKYIYNEGINVEASKAKLVVIYLKPKYFPIDMATSPNDQFRISVLTSNGGMIYGYGNGSEAWALRTDGASASLIQVDQMEDGWIRVQFKIHELDVWSEDAIVKGMAISFVQRKATPVMDIISVKSIELLDQEEFIDPRDADYVTKVEWNMSNAMDAADWTGYHAKKKLEALTTSVTDAGKAVRYLSPGNGWKGIVLENALVDISKLTGKLTFTYSSSLPITSYRIHLATDLGGSLTSNGTADCYVAANVGDIEAGKLPAWTRTKNADGSYTVTFDLSSMAYFANGEELKGLTIVTVTANKVTGTVTYKSIELETNLEGHNCQAEGHFMKPATCTEPATCYVCGATEGEPVTHSWEAATCQTPKTCAYCRIKEGTVSSHSWKAATCQTPKTCSVCGKKEGATAAHTFAEGFCSVCGVPEVIRTEWDMSNSKHAADWTAYHAKKKNEALTTTVTGAGTAVEYQSPGNGWKGLILENTQIETDKLTGKLTFTYSSDMAITSYRIHILTDKGGKLTANGTAACYTAASVSDIDAGNLSAWTRTTNADGSVTVTFDLSSMSYFAGGKTLKGLTIVTVTANSTVGTVTYKNIALELDLEGHDCQADGHIMKEATCTAPKTCYACGATEGEPTGHTWNAATCSEPKTCAICNLTEGEPIGHTWNEATCLAPKTCSVCGATEGELGNHADANADGKCDNCGTDCCAVHTWNEASCLAPKTCSVCGVTEGERLAHTDADKDHVCDVCADNMVVWYMNHEADAADWAGYHSKKKNEALTATVTEAGLEVAYASPGNGWKGLVLEDTAIDISKLTGKLTFTYSSDMAITSYRIHILTDLGGNLTANGTADCYTAVTIANITAGKLPAWTQTTNADGSVTVTFDLSSMSYFANGTELKGLTIVTVTANKVTGTVTYKSIELETASVEHDCEADGHVWKDATCTAPKTCYVCGVTEGEAIGHTWVDATCTEAKSCSVCGATEGEAIGHTWVDATCTAPKTCSVCGATEGEPAKHPDANADYKCDDCGANLCTEHTWVDATCTEPKTCSVCGTTEGEPMGHAWVDATCTEAKTCSVCGATEGEANGHTWSDASCLAPKTCSVCGTTEGGKTAHTDANKDLTCDVCADDMITWNMNNEADAADWAGYHSKKKNEALTATVTSTGLEVAYASPGNGWKGLVLENAAIDISKLSGKLTFTYSSDMAITSYRIHILTDLGGDLTANGTADCYTSASIANITAGSLEAWTQTTNADGSVTVTFDLSSMGYFANGTELKGLTIVTVTANKVTGTVTYKSIELEKRDCDVHGHIWSAATCTEPKVCALCGATEAGDHTWLENVCVKTCAVCGATEGDTAAHTFVGGACSVCGVKAWDTDSDGVLEILAIGNSFSTDAMEYTWQIAKALGIEKVVVGNLYIGGCTLNEHYANASGDLPNYKYYYCDNGTWTSTADCKLSTALESRSWDYVSLQQASPDSGVESTYNADLTNLIAYVKARSNAKLIWHMTWAYQQDSTHSAFPTYDSDQMTMYNAIVSAVKNKIVPNGNFALIVPNGTAVQNARTSLVGDTLTRDGYHMSKDYGRYLTGLMLIKTVTGLDISGIEYAPDGVSSLYREIAIESVNNAYAHPFQVTQSAYQEAEAEVVRNSWDMSKEEDAADWSGYHAKKKNESLTTTVTEAGLEVAYSGAGNGWKGLVLEDTAIDISKLTGKLTFTYSSDMAITSYRIHILTDLGGDLTANGTADCYTSASIADITAGSLEAWTQTTNADGSVTVTFDLSSMSYFANGTELKGLSIVTVTANKVTGTVTYKSIELESKTVEHDCETDGHVWNEATCAAPKTCSVCGATEGEVGDHTYVEGVCSVCGAAENAAATPIVWNMSSEADASQWYSAQAYTSVKPSVTTSEVTADGFVVNYLHKNGWKGIVLKNVEYNITGLSVLSFTYIEEMDITNYRIHVLTDLGGDLEDNKTGTPANYYGSVAVSDIAASSAWTRTENADGSVTVTFDLSTLPFFAEGTVLLGMDIVTVTATGTTGTVTYKTIEIR